MIKNRASRVESGELRRKNVKCDNCQWAGRRRFLNLPCPKCKHWRPIEVIFQEPRWSKELREYIAALGNKVAA